MSNGEQPIKVFIVDDSELIRRLVVGILSERSDTEIIGQADNVQNAICLIETLKPNVVILDVNMPDGSGIDVLRTVKTYNPSPFVIMFTNCPGYREKCMAEGADFFLDKSFNFDELGQVLEMFQKTMLKKQCNNAFPGNTSKPRLTAAP